MSAQYKVKKYMNKLENATDLAKMDTYYAKIKQYKMSQSGGAIGEGPWRKALEKQVEKLNEIGKFQTSIEQVIETHKADIQGIGDKFKDFADGHRKVEESLEDSLLYLKEVADKIKVGELDLDVLSPVFKAIADIDVSKYPAIDPVEIWNMIFNSSASNQEYVDGLKEINEMKTAAERSSAVTAFITAHPKK